MIQLIRELIRGTKTRKYLQNLRRRPRATSMKGEHAGDWRQLRQGNSVPGNSAAPDGAQPTF